MKQSRVIIVEDDVALRQSLAEWLSNEHVVSDFDSAEALIKAIDEFESADNIPTCILLDFQMSGMTGVELQAKLSLMNVHFPIIFMSGNALRVDIIDAWHGGAVDFLLKPFTGTKLSETIATLFHRVQTIQPLASSSIFQDELVDIPISQREAEVLLLLGSGHRQHEIARMLNITLRTVKWHRANIKIKLHLNTLVELTRYCDQHTSAIERVAQYRRVKR